MTDSVQPAPRSRRGCGCGALVLGCLGVIMLTVVSVVAVGVFVWWQWTSVPDYWEMQRARVQQLTPEQRDQLAEQTEHRLSSWLSDAEDADPQTNHAAAQRPRGILPEGERSLSLSFDEINAWLDRRLQSWMQQQEVDFNLPVREMIVTTQDGKLIVAGDVHVQRFNQIVSAVIDARMLPDGDMHIHVEHVRFGRIPVPTAAVVRQAREQIPQDEQTEAVKQVLQIFEGTTFTPAYRADDGTELRLTKWALDDDGIALTVENRPDAAP